MSSIISLLCINGSGGGLGGGNWANGVCWSEKGSTKEEDGPLNRTMSSTLNIEFIFKSEGRSST